MAQSYQQTSRTQQAHLKKYLAYIRQQTTEKKALERQVRDLKQYVDVLEKKVVSSTLVGNRKDARSRAPFSTTLVDVMKGKRELDI